MRAKVGIVMVAATRLVVAVQAASITHGSTTINMDFVDIGYAGNAWDTYVPDTIPDHPYELEGHGFGKVDYNYRIATCEVTIDQFAQVRAADDRVGNGNEGWYNEGWWYGGLYRVGVDAPASQVSWYEAAKFCNWLTTGDAYSGAYQFRTGKLIAVDRDAAVEAYGTVYVLPTEDEWYKAAFFKADGSGYTLYASGSSAPGVETDANYGGHGGTYDAVWTVGTGNPENNGTYDMNGNVAEWQESTYHGVLTDLDQTRVSQGGGFTHDESFLRSSYRTANGPFAEMKGVGFRVAAIPEPSSAILIAGIGALGVFVRRRFLIV